MLDITEVLTKSLCLEQIGTVTVLHLETLNKRLFGSLDELADTDIRHNNKYRFGTYLAKHAAALNKPKPEFNKIALLVYGGKKKRDRLSSIRKLQKQACEFIRSEMEGRLALDDYSLACQVLLPHKYHSESVDDFTRKLDTIIDANIGFIGGDSEVHRRRRKVEIGLRKLIKIFDQKEFKDFSELQVLEAYELIWTQGRF